MRNVRSTLFFFARRNLVVTCWRRLRCCSRCQCWLAGCLADTFVAHSQFNELSSFLFLNFQNHPPQSTSSIWWAKREEAGAVHDTKTKTIPPWFNLAREYKLKNCWFLFGVLFRDMFIIRRTSIHVSDESSIGLVFVFPEWAYPSDHRRFVHCWSH